MQPAELDALENDADAERLGQLLSSVLMKDMRIVENTAAMCRSAINAEQRATQRAYLEAASADLREAISEETAALDACAVSFASARKRIETRGRELFGEA